MRLGPEIEKRLRTRRVLVESGDENTAILRNIATNSRFFNKPVTNLLIKRARTNLPFLFCVDEDLEYLGRNPGVAQVFTGATRVRGWRILAACSETSAERMDDLVGGGLAILGCEGRDPALTWPLVAGALPSASSLLTRLGQELFAGEELETAVGRDEEVEQIAAVLTTDEPLMPIVIGASGVGKTSVVRGTLRRVAEIVDGRAFIIDLGELLAGALGDAERESRMAMALGEARQSSVQILIIENLQLGLAGSTNAPFLLAAALENGIRIIGTMGPKDRPLIERPPLRRHLVSVTLIEPRREETCAILRMRRPRAEDRYGVQVADELLDQAVVTADSLAGAYPAKAIALLDVAMSRARLMGAKALSAEHIQIAAIGFSEQVHDRTPAG